MRRTLAILLGAVLAAAPAEAQQSGEPRAQPARTDARPYSLYCEHKEFVDQRWTCKGQVRFEQGDTKIFSDELEFFEAEDRAIATGNVTFTQGRNQINSDRAEVNTETRLGTFYSATGATNIRNPRPAMPTAGGFVAPQMAGQQETEVYFFGEVVKKLGAKKYEITNGGFTTCVQPTPRWDLHAGKITLNVDDYALLTSSAFNVKGVPVLYLPWAYYPISEDGRNTGFLLPTWGTSTFNGQSIGNQFFWAISRSQDATFMHDWYSKTGNGAGAEYRYNIGSGSGRVTSYLLNSTVQSSGDVSSASRSFNMVGSANQSLPHRFRSSANVNYFSSVSTNQAFMTNIADSSRSQRTYGGNVAGMLGRYSINGTFQRSEYFPSLTSSALTGTSPQVMVIQGERPLFGAAAPIYFGFTSEYAHIDRQTRVDDVLTDDRTLSRIDVQPRLRYPLKRWEWLAVNSSMTWRDTFYTRSQDPETLVNGTPLVVEDNLNRQYFDFQADVAGPILNRVWDTPDLGYAEKFKHTVEPFLAVKRTTTIDDFDRVVAGVDVGVVGGVTSYSYGVNNRLYAKKRVGETSQAQQILSLGIGQAYYTDARASQYDPRFASSFSGAPPSKFTPIRLDLNATPATTFSGNLRAEIDPKYRELRTLSVGARHMWSGGSSDISWNQRFLVPDLAGFNTPESVNRSLTASTTAHTRDQRYGGMYSFVFDAVRSDILQQSIQGYYNAQCCGFSFHYSRSSYSTLPTNNKFLFSFTLAGLGSFSPFDGGLNAIPR